MTQEFEQRRRRRDYDRMVDVPSKDSMSVEQVEEIIRRAVELQVEDDLSLPKLDEQSLHRVAKELGIEAGHLRRAIAEARTPLTDPEPSVFDRLLAPRSVTTSRIIRGDREDVEGRLGAWMQRNEGLRLRRKDRDGGIWEKDPHLWTRLRMGLRLNRGSRVLRNNRKVAHRIQTMRADEQVLALEAETHTLKTVGLAGLAGLGAAAVAGGAVGAVTGDPAVAIPAAAGGFAVGSAGLIIGVRVWLSRIKDGLERVLDGVSSRQAVEPDPLERRVKRLRAGLQEAQEEFKRRRGWWS